MDIEQLLCMQKQLNVLVVHWELSKKTQNLEPLFVPISISLHTCL